MRIATMVNGYIPLPRPHGMVYAPMDLAVAISEGLTKRGHTVDFYAPMGTALNVPVKNLNLRPLEVTPEEFHKALAEAKDTVHKQHFLWDQYFVSEMYRLAQQGQYDLLYFHHPDKALPLAKLCQGVPTVYTLHDPISPEANEMYEMYWSPNQFFVSISCTQRKPAPQLPFLDTVYNGINLDEFPYSAKNDDYLLMVCRILPEKGVREGIEVARRTGQRLKIIGEVHPYAKEYFEKEVKPFLDDKITYVGAVERSEITKYFQRAKALLMPIKWEEPFGMVMVEAMSCGTPVIAFSRGAAPEVIEDGKTGFLVKNIDEMVEAVKKIDTIKRKDCHDHVVGKFSTDTMVDAYEAAFEKALDEFRNLGPHVTSRHEIQL
jgi:glycosyltransferase involved in cell wall biosynthesis